MTSTDELFDRFGTTYTEQAEIRLRDKPSPLYQLIVLSMLLSARIRADTANAAAREVFAAGWRSPRTMVESTWQQRVDALGRGEYVRYDVSTANVTSYAEVFAGSRESASSAPTSSAVRHRR